MILRAFFGLGMMMIAAAALGAPPAAAQNEGMGVLGPRVTQPEPPQLRRRDGLDPECAPEKLAGKTVVDQAVCADLALLQKHHRVAELQLSLKRWAAADRAVQLELMHDGWLADRGQCIGADLAACLHRRYDARIRELADAIIAERLRQP